MPLYTATRAGGGTQFAGTTAANGLFAVASTGAGNIRLQVFGIWFSTSSTITSWTLNAINPASGQVVEILTDDTTDFVLGGPSGFMMLPVSTAGVPWQLSFVTDTMAASGTLNIDYDFQLVP